MGLMRRINWLFLKSLRTSPLVLTWPLLAHAMDPLIWIHSTAPFISNSKSGILFESTSEHEFTRIDLFISEPLVASEMRLQSCDGLRDSVSVALNQGEWVTRAEPREDMSFTWPIGKLSNRRLRSASLQFSHNKKICIKSLQFFTASGVEKKINWPQKSPVPNFERSASELRWNWANPVEIRDALVWMGDRHIKSNRSIYLETENARVEIPQQPGLQKIHFDEALKTKQVRGDHGILGIIFLNSENQWFWREEKLEEKIIHLNSAASLIIDREWYDVEEKKWIFRFRSDGSFFIKGEGKKSFLGAVGTFDVQMKSPRKFKLKLAGVRLRLRPDADVPPCLENCLGKFEVKDADRLNDELELALLDSTTWMIRNKSPLSRRTLSFGDMKVRPSHVDD